MRTMMTQIDSRYRYCLLWAKANGINSCCCRSSSYSRIVFCHFVVTCSFYSIPLFVVFALPTKYTLYYAKIYALLWHSVFFSIVVVYLFFFSPLALSKFSASLFKFHHFSIRSLLVALFQFNCSFTRLL